MQTAKLFNKLSPLGDRIIRWVKGVRFIDFVEGLKILQEIAPKFVKVVCILILLLPFFYFGAFHGKCTSRISTGAGGSGYRYLHLHEQFFFGILLSKKAWWDLADNAPDFDSTSFNEGTVNRWRGFGYLIKWEESYDVVYQ